MSVSRLTDQIATAWGSYVIDFNALFRFHKVETGKPEFFAHLASLLASREALRSDFFRLADSIKRSDGTLSDADLLSIVALAIGGSNVAAGGDLAVPLSLLSIFSAGLHGKGSGLAEDFGSPEVAIFRTRTSDPEPHSMATLRPLEVAAQMPPAAPSEQEPAEASPGAAINPRSIYQALLAAAQRDSIAQQDSLAYCDPDPADRRNPSAPPGRLDPAGFAFGKHDEREPADPDRTDADEDVAAGSPPGPKGAEPELRLPALQPQIQLGPTLAAAAPHLAPRMDGHSKPSQAADLKAWPRPETATPTPTATAAASLSLAPRQSASFLLAPQSLSPPGSGPGSGAPAVLEAPPIYSGAPTPSSVSSPTPDLSPELRRLRTAVAAIAMLLLVAIASGGVFAYRLHSAVTAQRRSVSSAPPARVAAGPLSPLPTPSHSPAPTTPPMAVVAPLPRVEPPRLTLIPAGATKPVPRTARELKQAPRAAAFSTPSPRQAELPTAQRPLQPTTATAAAPQNLSPPRTAPPVEGKPVAETVSSSSSSSPPPNANNAILRPAISNSGEGSPASIAASYETVSRSHGALLVPGDMVMRNAISTPKPYYPFDARIHDIEGNVVVEVVISKRGTVQKARAVSGPSPLRANAIGAVQTWHFRPFLVNGKPNEVSTNLNVPFSLR